MALLWLWSGGDRVYWDDLIANRMTQAFLRQCAQTGRLTEKEFAGLSLGGSTTGHSKPDRLILYADLIEAVCEDIDWPEEDVRRCLALRLEEENLLSQHIEYYLNYPAWTIPGLAEAFGVDRDVVRAGLRRVRATWPALRLDGTKAYGVPHLNKMVGFYATRKSDDTEFNRLDCTEVVPVCGRFSTEPITVGETLQ